MKRVVIIGGGFAGTIIAEKLQKEFNTILIDDKEYFEYTPGILRTIVEPQHVNKIQRKHQTYLTNTEFICAEVSSIAPSYVTCLKKKIPYDYLVLASGSSYGSPIKGGAVVSADRAKTLHKHHAQVKQAQHVLIIGGGIVGVELAAEIAETFPGKKITLVESNDTLMKRSPPKAQEYATRYLKRHDVHIIYNERVEGKKNQQYVTNKARNIDADMAFLCIGITPNSTYLRKNYKNVLDERGFVQVNNYLQVKGHAHIYAPGDINNIKEEKLAQNAEIQADIVAQNIKNQELNQPLNAYESKPRVIVISLGKKKGIIIKKNLVIGGVIPAIMKEGIERYVMYTKGGLK